MDVSLIETKLAQVREERDVFLRQAERQVAAYDGAIQALEQLLNEYTLDSTAE